MNDEFDGRATEAPAVAMRGITKRFPGVVANDEVDLEVAVGEVHASRRSLHCEALVDQIRDGTRHPDPTKNIIASSPVFSLGI